MAIGNALLGQDLAPGVLRVVEDEGDEIHERLFLLIEGSIGLRHRGCAAVDRAGADQRQKIALEDQAQDEQYDDSAQPQMNSYGLKAAAAIVTAIFNVITPDAGGPAHGYLVIRLRSCYLEFRTPLAIRSRQTLSQIRVKGGGQECPPHTDAFRLFSV